MPEEPDQAAMGSGPLPHVAPVFSNGAVATSGSRGNSGERSIGTKDLLLLLALPFMTAAAWLLPEVICEWLTDRVARLSYRTRTGRYADYAQMFRTMLPSPQNDADLGRLIEKTVSLHHLERLHLLRYYRPGSWRPKIRLAGRDHLERALVRGRGAILWIKPTSCGDIELKAAFRREGYPVFHLSRHTHGGFSTTRFGIKFLNPIRVCLERRYLAKRIVIDPQKPKAALEVLAELLSRNQIVSIAVGAEARRVTMVPVAAGVVPLAGGAADLAIKTGAMLLPVFAERHPDGSFLVIVEAPIEVAPKCGSHQERVTQMLHRYGSLLSVYFLRKPEQNHCVGLYRAGGRASF